MNDQVVTSEVGIVCSKNREKVMCTFCTSEYFKKVSTQLQDNAPMKCPIDMNHSLDDGEVYKNLSAKRFCEYMVYKEAAEDSEKIISQCKFCDHLSISNNPNIIYYCENSECGKSY